MKHFRPRLSRRAFWVLCALLVCLRLALTGFQQAYIWVGGAPLDDELMFRAANHITAGQWLGAYDYLTLSKAMFFPVWLATAARAAPAVSYQRRGALVRGGTAGGVCIFNAVA